MDEGDGFVGGFGGEDVAEGDVFEAVGLADIVVVRYINSCCGSTRISMEEVTEKRSFSIWGSKTAGGRF